jgi:beta-galactosidase/beta-glucuronidase
VLGVSVDSRWLPIPPDDSLKGPAGVDYLEPGGIVRPVSLYIVPQVFIADVFAKLVDVLDSDRHVEVMVSLDAGRVEPGPLQLRTELVDGEKVIAAAQQTVRLAKPGETQVELLWDNENPRLYTVVTKLSAGGKRCTSTELASAFARHASKRMAFSSTASASTCSG